MSPTPLNQVPDAELLLAVSRGDEESFAELYRRYERPAFSLAYRLTGSYEAAEDSVQRAFFRIWSSAGRFLADGNPRGWILKILAREGMVSLKGLRHQKALHDRELAKPVDEARGSAPEALERQEIHQALQAQLDQLPEEMRRLMALYFGARLSQHEIGRILALPQRTVSDRLNLALARLRVGLVAAGFAKARLALDPGILSAALLSGVEVPAGLGPRILRTPASERCVAGPGALHRLGKLGAGVAALLAVAAAGTACWIAVPFSGPVHPSRTAGDPQAHGPAGEAGPSDAGRPEATRAFARSWNFNDPSGEDGLQVLRGSWRRVTSGGPDGSGCMACEAAGTEICLQVPSHVRLLKVTWQQRSLAPDPPSGFRVLPTWSRFGAMAEFLNFYERRIPSRTWVRSAAYLAPDRNDLWIEGRRAALLWYDGGEGGVNILFWDRHLLDNLEVREISPQDLPEAGACLNAVAALAPRYRDCVALLPGLATSNPPWPVFTHIFRASDKWITLGENPSISTFHLVAGVLPFASHPASAQAVTDPEGSMVLLPYAVEPAGVQGVEVQGQIVATRALADSFLADTSALGPFTQWPVAQVSLAPGTRHTFRSYILGWSKVFDFVDGSLVKVRSYASPAGTHAGFQRIGLKLRGVAVEELRVWKLEAKDLPQQVRGWTDPPEAGPSGGLRVKREPFRYPVPSAGR